MCLINVLFGDNFGFTETLQRQYREFPYTLNIVFPKVIILHKNNTFVKTKNNIGTLLLTQLQISFRFYQFFHECPFSVPGSDPECHNALSSGLLVSSNLSSFIFHDRSNFEE